MERLRHFLQRPENAANLAIFRIGYGIIMSLQLFQFARLLQSDYWINGIHISYVGLEFIPALPIPIQYVIVCSGIIAAILVAAGLFFRPAIVILTLSFGYFFFLDKILFNNHYYLFFLLGFLLWFTNADRRFSLRAGSRQGTSSRTTVPNWQYLILQLQVFIVFFYGGLAKINEEWLFSSLTVKMVERSLGNFESLEFAGRALAWSGMLFDLFIGFLLIWRPTRNFALVAVLLFNFINGIVLFDDIGYFPYAMILACFTLFGARDFIDKRFFVQSKTKSKKSLRQSVADPATTNTPRWIAGVLGLYFIFQLTFPLRHYLIEGNPEWTGQGHHFAWRMKSFTKQVVMQFMAFDKATGQPIGPLKVEMTPKLKHRFGIYPHNIWHVGQVLSKRMEEEGRSDVRVGVLCKVSMNGAPAQYVIDPLADLGAVKYRPMGKNDWIFPWGKGTSLEALYHAKGLDVEELARQFGRGINPLAPTEE
ncbi:MAG: HTTM domain-containing protein [Saprospiraceae bacterium]|nr:HTTM domain-containing protein [Saprospiraceae bacterium]